MQCVQPMCTCITSILALFNPHSPFGNFGQRFDRPGGRLISSREERTLYARKISAEVRQARGPAEIEGTQARTSDLTHVEK